MRVKTTLFVLAILYQLNALAQNSSILELAAETRGFLPPVMTENQMTAIGSPVEGLMVYCTDCMSIGTVYFFDGTSWIGFVTDYHLFIKRENLAIMVNNLQIELENLEIINLMRQQMGLECELRCLEGGQPKQDVPDNGGM